jgi:ubiquinone/menaquinone biosynthesis C-methylase UbiE
MASVSILHALKSLADPTRLRLLLLLQGQELSVAELQDVLGIGQSRASNHLAQLKRAGLVTHRRSGKNSYYTLAEHAEGPLAGAGLRELLADCAAELPEAETDRLALEVALNRRKDKAREYFNELAGRFGKDFVPGRSWQALARMLLGLLPPLRIADLGAGEGTLTQLLSKRAMSVIAVDLSPKMVELGRALAAEHGFDNLDYRLGDLENPPIDPGSVDLAVFSQALHHAANPQAAIDAAARILAPGGRIAILDLLNHNFEEARELYADTWLGFSEADLFKMLRRAGFEDIETTIAARMPEPPHFQTILALARKAG